MTLDAGLYLGYKNDVAFMIADSLNLYEHQSTENANMPLRGLFYLATGISASGLRAEMDIYRKSLLMLPLPRYIVLCNASEMKEENQFSGFRMLTVSRERRALNA